MKRAVRNLLLVSVLAAIAAVTVVLQRSHDPVYVIQEWVNRGQFHKYDDLIVQVAERHGVDPLLVKALVWRESTFRPDKVGKDDERGLMQVLPSTAGDWAKAQKIEDFHADQLFDPKTNLEAGTWYLKQALTRWKTRDDPVPFALAEYNAGPSRAVRWAAETRMGDQATADDFFSEISFPTTRAYVDSVVERYRFYQRRGRL